jgi:tetratricopeptide (TPR) repeat protein
MRIPDRPRALAALALAFLMLAAPMSALAKKGEKNFKRGVAHERAQQWEQAAQEFALAVAASPSDTEYQLHYRRAVFNASQVYMQKGRALAEQGDYVGGYNAFRQAYGLDPVNELAANEMRRMLRLQREKEGLDPEPEEGMRNGVNNSGRPRLDRTSLQPNGAARGAAVAAAVDPADDGPSQPLRQINYSGDLEDYIRKMAEELNLNVVFDQQFSQTKRNIKVQLRDVTAAQALDYVFTAYGLFFQKLSRRTILVADQSKRPQYQQLVLKTFYLYNIKPNDARTLIQTALPANAGRQPQVVTNAETNSVIVRDTPENIRIIGELLKSVDKERAEVVMEVSIYEVSRTDLLQIGNQFGNGDVLTNLGGLQTGSVIFDGARRIATATAGATVPVSTGVGLLIPSSSLSLLQRKDNTRLVFSTQVHAFDDEKSEARVGARVPVQTAAVYNGLTTAPTGGTAGSPGNVFGGNGYPRHPIRRHRPRPRLHPEGLSGPGGAGEDEHRDQRHRRQQPDADLHAAQDHGHGPHPERAHDDARQHRPGPREQRPAGPAAHRAHPHPGTPLHRAAQEQRPVGRGHHADATHPARARDHAQRRAREAERHDAVAHLGHARSRGPRDRPRGRAGRGAQAPQEHGRADRRARADNPRTERGGAGFERRARPARSDAVGAGRRAATSRRATDGRGAIAQRRRGRDVRSRAEGSGRRRPGDSDGCGEGSGGGRRRRGG